MGVAVAEGDAEPEVQSAGPAEIAAGRDDALVGERDLVTAVVDDHEGGVLAPQILDHSVGVVDLAVDGNSDE
jgi:hypothetical protein